MTIKGKAQKITLKNLYKLAYNKVFCIDNIEDLEGEEWKVIEGTNNNYYCSNKGRIKSYCGYNAIIVKSCKNNKNYEKVRIVQYGISKNCFVHRIVASCFLPPPKNIYCETHHINLDNSLNFASNLIWLTPFEHIQVHNEIIKTKKNMNYNEILEFIKHLKEN